MSDYNEAQIAFAIQNVRGGLLSPYRESCVIQKHPQENKLVIFYHDILQATCLIEVAIQGISWDDLTILDYTEFWFKNETDRIEKEHYQAIERWHEVHQHELDAIDLEYHQQIKAAYDKVLRGKQDE